MEAIRRTVTVRNNTITVELPEDYNNKTVDLIIQESQEKPTIVQEPSIDYKKLYGTLNLGLTVEEIDKELKDLRNEWERDIS